MTSYVNQTDLSEFFGISFEEMDKILIEHGLKSSELATQKAIDGGYACFSTIPAPAPRNYWNPIKISELTGRKLLDEIGLYAQDVMWNIQHADEQPDLLFGLLIATHAYDEVPEALRNEVQKRVDREMIGDRRQSCKKCGRMTFWSVKDLCWRCLPDDPFMQQRLDYEAAARAEAAQLARANWGTLYKDRSLEPKDSDIELWNGAVDTTIDAFLVSLIDPSRCDKRLARTIIDECTHDQALTEFVFSGFDDHGGRARCSAFLKLAYETVAGVLLQEEA